MGDYPAWPSQPGRGGATPRRVIVAIVVVVILAVAAFSAAAILLFGGFADYLECPHTCPSSFAPEGIERVSPNSPGCQSPLSEVCFEAQFTSALDGLTLSHLRFVVANESNVTVNGPVAPPLPLGRMATVSALSSSDQVVGVWSVNASIWENGSQWSVPANNSNVSVILDTGLDSNVSLSNAGFFIILTAPYEGAMGFPLFCGGC
jgi:hypothetical protein